MLELSASVQVPFWDSCRGILFEESCCVNPKSNYNEKYQRIKHGISNHVSDMEFRVFLCFYIDMRI